MKQIDVWIVESNNLYLTEYGFGLFYYAPMSVEIVFFNTKQLADLYARAYNGIVQKTTIKIRSTL